MNIALTNKADFVNIVNEIMKYLESKKGIASGELVIRGTRIRITQFLMFLKEGHTLEEIHSWYPWISMRKLSGAIDEAIAQIDNLIHA